MNLLNERIFSIAGRGPASLPGTLAALSAGEAPGFAALRPHQRAGWHSLLVQLGALACLEAGSDALPGDEGAWADRLRALTPEHPDDAPWRLVADDPRAPAFLQPPDPGIERWAEVATPDGIDLLAQSRNHDLKRAAAMGAQAEDWVFALVSIQTGGGTYGRGRHPIARMNRGFSSRFLMGLAPAGEGEADCTVDPSAWWRRDVRRLLGERRADGGADGLRGDALLWTLDWEEGEQLRLETLDPLFVEVCRRIRLRAAGDGLRADRAGSARARIDAQDRRGNVGDPWAPVHAKKGSTLTYAGGGLGSKLVCQLLFSGDWTLPPLARPGPEDAGPMVLVLEALARGQGKTNGHARRQIRVPALAVPALGEAATADAAKRLREWVDAGFAAVRQALGAAASSQGGRPGRRAGRQSLDGAKAFLAEADQGFFPALWRQVEADRTSAAASEAASLENRLWLLDAARRASARAAAATSCPPALRPALAARAGGLAEFRLRALPEFADLPDAADRDRDAGDG